MLVARILHTPNHGVARKIPANSLFQLGKTFITFSD